MKTLNTLLSELDACNIAKNWAKDKTIEQVVAECERGDWLLWLYFRLDFDKRKLTLAKGLCASTVRHLMTDERSIKAVDAAIAYGNNGITDKELRAYAADAAHAAYAAAHAAHAAHAAYVADAAAAAHAADAYAAHAADAAHAAYAAAHAAYAAAHAAAYAAHAADAYAAAENKRQTAQICREIFGQHLIELVNKKLK